MASKGLVTFPNDILLTRLLDVVPKTCAKIHDDYGYVKTYPDMLHDIVATRGLLIAQLPPLAIDSRNLVRAQYQHMATLTPSGYEFLVAFFAIRSIGGVCMPLS